jgi:hypothetical protein
VPQILRIRIAASGPAEIRGQFDEFDAGGGPLDRRRIFSVLFSLDFSRSHQANPQPAVWFRSPAKYSWMRSI